MNFLSGAICSAQTATASIETTNTGREPFHGLGWWKRWLQISSGCHGAARGAASEGNS